MEFALTSRRKKGDHFTYVILKFLIWKALTGVHIHCVEDHGRRHLLLCGSTIFPSAHTGATNFMGLASGLAAWLRRANQGIPSPGLSRSLQRWTHESSQAVAVLSGASFGAVGELLLHLLWGHRYEPTTIDSRVYQTGKRPACKWSQAEGKKRWGGLDRKGANDVTFVPCIHLTDADVTTGLLSHRANKSPFLFKPVRAVFL